MKAENRQLTEFLGSNRQYYIPIFQRKYSWEVSDCKKLFLDILSVANDTVRPCHFIGSIIYLPLTNFAATNQCAVVDGQQRLTTLSLFLLALADYTREYYPKDEMYNQSESRLEAIRGLYLINPYVQGDLQYKLKLNDEDFTVYKQLLENRKLPVGITYSNIYRNYKTLLTELRNSKVSPEFALTGIRKLMLVDIYLDNNDNAQLVFETVNSTGKTLSETEKIKNYILMTVAATKQIELYNDYWKVMEDYFEKEKNATSFDEFFKYFLTIKLKRKVGYEYYDVFKEYVLKSKKNTTEVIEEAYQYFLLYKKWVAADFGHDRIDIAMNKIKKTGQGTAIPVVLQVLYDLQYKVCSAQEALEIFALIESYWVRRRLLSTPTNTASSVCFLMLKALGADQYVDAFKECIRNFTWAQRMPDNKEVLEYLKTAKLYVPDGDNSWLRYTLLDNLEHHKQKEYQGNEKYSIEHIMPETIWSTEELYKKNMSNEEKEKRDWASDLGENWRDIYEKYTHTLGNLTLSLASYNSKYSNYRFDIKKTMTDESEDGRRYGYMYSPVNISISLSKKEKWGEEEILARTEEMAKLFFEIWPEV
jgi:uncharacterized protein with ParB-like and HNH nuclease domain